MVKIKLRFYEIDLKLFHLIFFLALFFTVKTRAEELPRGSTENCLYILPIFETIRVPGALTNEAKRTQFLKMKQQLGNGNLYHRLGFSFIYGPNADAAVREDCALAQEYGVHLGLIFALQSHTRDDFRAVAAKDLRLFQWRKDGNDWRALLPVPAPLRCRRISVTTRFRHLRVMHHPCVNTMHFR